MAIAPSARHIAVSLWLTGAGKKKEGAEPRLLVRSLDGEPEAHHKVLRQRRKALIPQLIQEPIHLLTEMVADSGLKHSKGSASLQPNSAGQILKPGVVTKAVEEWLRKRNQIRRMLPV